MTTKEQRKQFESDPYLAGAALVLQKNITEVTKEERERFKIAFINTFHVRGAELVKSSLDYLRCVLDEIEDRNMLDNVSVNVEHRLKEINPS